MTKNQAARLIAEERDPREGWREVCRRNGLSLAFGTTGGFEYWEPGANGFFTTGWSIDLYSNNWRLDVKGEPGWAEFGTSMAELEAVILAMLIQGEAER